MSRRMIAPGVWVPEGPREAVRTDPRIRGYAIETRGTTPPSMTAAGQREYRERRRAQAAARRERAL